MDTTSNNNIGLLSNSNEDAFDNFFLNNDDLFNLNGNEVQNDQNIPQSDLSIQIEKQESSYDEISANSTNTGDNKNLNKKKRKLKAKTGSKGNENNKNKKPRKSAQLRKNIK